MTVDISRVTEQCPPNGDAYCVCGEELKDHRTSDPDAIATPGDAECPYDLASAFWDKRTAVMFRLAEGQSLDCPDASWCIGCDHPLCVEHSPSFATCVDGGLHCDDCVDRCRSCQLESRF